MRVCVFVDGENLRHTLHYLFDERAYRRQEYLPKAAKWAEFFDRLVALATEGEGRRTRTYWYVVEDVDPYPQIPSLSDRDDQHLQEWLRANRRLLEQCDRLPFTLQNPDLNDVRGTLGQLDAWREEIKQRFDGFAIVQRGIAQAHRAIEFRRSGAIGYNLLTKQLGQEKTVDVNLGVDMVTLSDSYDLALVVSGDQDYVPAVQAVKNRGKHVVNVAFKTRGCRLLPGGDRRLNQMTDWNLPVEYEDVAAMMLSEGALPG